LIGGVCNEHNRQTHARIPPTVAGILEFKSNGKALAIGFTDQQLFPLMTPSCKSLSEKS
jgi:hypothetical protein